MQTFLPYADFQKSAECLDRARLGKQRVEAYQILCSILRPDYGWKNHPTVKMWRDHPAALFSYAFCIVEEWKKRGYLDSMALKLQELHAVHLANLPVNPYLRPDWFGGERFHSSHRAALLAKDFKHYSQFGWSEKPEISYYWPV